MVKKTRSHAGGSQTTAQRRPNKKGSSNAAQTKRGNKGALRVRMYRHGLGDCFLITLPKTDGTPLYMMIDCGIIVGSPNPSIMEDVVKNIITDTDGFVDILVVTHEHYDHVSGFAIAKDLFVEKRMPGKLAVGKVWFAWTEDPADTFAKGLRRDREKRKEKLAALVADLGSEPENSSLKGLAEPIDSVLGFFGMEKGKLKTEGKAKAGGTGDAMKFVASLAPVRYCRPTDKPITLPDVSGVRIYVLGPPADDKMLKKTDSKTEVYHLASLGAAQSFFMTLTEGKKDNKDDLERYQPFEPPARYRLSDMNTPSDGSGSALDRHRKFFADHYFGIQKGLGADQPWRRIDEAYKDAAAEFALQLDSATNNTSLVLALELIDSGKVLLFVGDAQVGNWLSWQDVQWKLDADTTVTASDLLRRTVFYKVGHHGSHNATAKAKGLELMQSDDLVAFIPVNHKMAVKKGWCKMPLPHLVEELKARTQGRLVLADEDYQPPNTPKGKAFAAGLAPGPKGQEELFYEWTVPLN
jgi:hypothetical protein